MSEEAKKKRKKTPKNKPLNQKRRVQQMLSQTPENRNPHALDALLNRPAGPSDKRKQRTKRKRDVPRGNTKHKKDLRQQYASATRVATMYLLSGKDKRNPGYSTFRRPGGQKYKNDPRPGARPRDTYDDKQHSTHTWIKVMRRMLNKGMDPDDVVNRLVRNHDVPRSMAKDYVYDAASR